MSTLIDEMGGPAAVARMLGIKPPSVIGWKGRIPKERCPEIERSTEGRYTVETLRSDIVWQRVPDPTWPHPDGRPCIDVAAPAATEVSHG
jgi:DNA-binding transcriptional regulator YdaS (Cro superfamily)